MNLNHGKIFNITFKKIDGKVRSINARLGVKSYSNGKGLKYNPSDRGNLIIFSMNDCGWRTVKVQNIISIKDRGVLYANMNTLISK